LRCLNDCSFPFSNFSLNSCKTLFLSPYLFLPFLDSLNFHLLLSLEGLFDANYLFNLRGLKKVLTRSKEPFLILIPIPFNIHWDDFRGRLQMCYLLICSKVNVLKTFRMIHRYKGMRDKFRGGLVVGNRGRSNFIDKLFTRGVFGCESRS